MSTVTTVYDVFEMAKGMEQIGMDFYTALALSSDSAPFSASSAAACTVVRSISRAWSWPVTTSYTCPGRVRAGAGSRVRVQRNSRVWEAGLGHAWLGF